MHLCQDEVLALLHLQLLFLKSELIFIYIFLELVEQFSELNFNLIIFYLYGCNFGYYLISFPHNFCGPLLNRDYLIQCLF